MRRRFIVLASLLLCAGACANVLGISDYEKASSATIDGDASVADVRRSDTTVDAPRDVTVDVRLDALDAALRGIVCNKTVCPMGGVCCPTLVAWTDAVCRKDRFSCLGSVGTLACDEASDCAAAESCCADTTGGGFGDTLRSAECRPGRCRGGEDTLCDPADPRSCAAEPGRVCKLVMYANGLEWLSACR